MLLDGVGWYSGYIDHCDARAVSDSCNIFSSSEKWNIIHPWGRQLADNGSGPALSATPGDQGRGTAPYIQLELYILLYSASNIQLCIYSASTTYPPASCIWLQLDTSNKNQFKYSLPFIQLHIYNNSVLRFNCTFIQLLIYIPPSILCFNCPIFLYSA